MPPRGSPASRRRRALLVVVVAAGAVAAVAVQHPGDRMLTAVLLVPGAVLGVLAARWAAPRMRRPTRIAETANDALFVLLAVSVCAVLVYVLGPASGVVVGLLAGFLMESSRARA